MKKIFIFVSLLVLMPVSVLAAVMPPSGDSSFSSLPLMCTGGMRCVYKGSGPQQVLRFAVHNTGVNVLTITDLMARYEGVATQTEFAKVLWYDDVNGVKLGESVIDYQNKTAALSGIAAQVAPSGVMEITVYVTLKANAVTGRTATFRVEDGDIVTDGGVPAGVFPAAGPMVTICNQPAAPTGAPSISVMTPNGGETVIRGGTQQLIWRSVNAPVNAYVRKVELYKGGVFVQYIDTESTPRSFIGTRLCASQSVRWRVPADLVPGNNYRIRVRLYKGMTDNLNQIATDISDTNFRIQ